MLRIASDVISLLVLGLAIVGYMASEVLIFMRLYLLAEWLRQLIDHVVDGFMEVR